MNDKLQTTNYERQTTNYKLRTTNYKLTLFLLLLAACKQGTQHTDEAAANDRVSVPLQYATGFTITKIGDARLIEVNYPYQGATSGHKYLLVEKGKDVPAGVDDARVIYTPIERIVCTSTTHIPMLDYLGETGKLVGFPTPDYISSPKMRARIDSGEVQNLGVDNELNVERLAVLKPDLVMGYTLSGNYGTFKKIESLGIPVVINAEYLEKDPLGRAEWIRFVAAFFNKAAAADTVFDKIEKEYLSVRALTADVAYKPTVMSGIIYGDAWFLPGGRNYAARLFYDAGYRYLWEDDPSHGFLQLSFESVYETAHDADLWIGVGAFESLQELEDAEHRYVQFRPFKEKNVYTYNQRIGAKGGNEFLELGYLRPDIILKDLVKIAHPERLPAYQLYFHEKLE